MNVNQILERVRDGHVPSKLEMGFLMVDIAPTVATNAPRAFRKTRPPTYVTLSPQQDRDRAPAMVLVGADEESETFCVDWRQKRMAASLLRRRPAA
ncbi:MAG: hypothetical protein ACHRHE_16010 [Tepidisphaerales bacterium]